MGALILDGNLCAAAVRERVAATLTEAGRPAICLATVLVGDDGPSQRYVRSKQKDAEAVGMMSRHVGIDASASQAEVEDKVGALVADDGVHGILVQLPLPTGLNADRVIDLLTPEKDVDGLTDRNLGRLVRGVPGHVPCTPRGVMLLLDHFGISVSGKRAIVIGRSLLVGTPLALLMARKGVDATVTIAHSRTPDLAATCRSADIIVAAAGQAHMVKADWVKPGATVIDVGISRSEGSIVGDVDFDAVVELAGAITPMPGGTGPMTRACLLENTLEAARMQGAL
jgi:methylenetetrahydrofolate dehydrogenase (NADP+) / methenyltetrahydrofolate cyclohydrolase